MISDDSFNAYQPPFDTDDAREPGSADEVSDARPPLESDEDVAAAKRAWEADRLEPADDVQSSGGAEASASPGDDTQLAQLAEPFVGRWHRLISTTNWEKGRIISEWRQRLIDNGAPATDYSDEAWARRVGGVTAPHVGRLRRVYDRFGSTHETYDGLYWSHFLAALDWDDAPLWLEGAAREGWSVSQMREQRWQAHGAVESQRPTASQVIEVDTDEDVVLPAQGGGRTKDYDDQPGGVQAGPAYEPPDFGEADELTAVGDPEPSGGKPEATEPEPDWDAPVQPFAGLPELPDDLADAIEQLKLAILRHKTAGWENVAADTVQRYLDAVGLLVRS